MALVSAFLLFALATLAFQLSAATGIAAPAPKPANNEFHFIVLGDSQFDDPATFNRMIDDMAHILPAFVVQVGDMIEGYTNDLSAITAQWERFAHQIAPLKEIPYVPVPGNHDQYNAHGRSDSRIESLYRDRWGPTYHSFDYRNGQFIVLNSDVPQEEKSIGPNQFTWLQQTLSASTAEHIFVFMHQPPDMLSNEEALHELLRQHPVRYVFYGHLHHYHFRQRDDIGYIMTNAAANSFASQPMLGSFDHFLQVSVNDADVRFASIKADSIHPPDYVAPRDNYDMFLLINSLAPAQVELTHHDHGWLMAIPLTNPTQRDLTIYAECGAADERWRHEPERIPKINLGREEQHELRLSWVASDSEFSPSCELTIPFQTHRGEWLQQVIQVQGVRND